LVRPMKYIVMIIKTALKLKCLKGCLLVYVDKFKKLVDKFKK